MGDRLEIGDTVQITSSEGILKALDAAALVADTPRAKKLGILQGEYTEEDHIISSTWNAIPIEVGNCYLIYLDDDSLERKVFMRKAAEAICMNIMIRQFTADGI